MRNDSDDDGVDYSGKANIFGALMMLVPLGIGLSTMVFVWSQPTNGFGGMPVFFKVFASCIAFAFIVIGATGVTKALAGTGPFSPGQFADHRHRLGRRRQGTPPSSGYVCDKCGAGLGEGADVSPSGDVKCNYCNTWFNIHV